MKIGLKIYPDNFPLIEKQDDLFDFFEVYVTPDFPFDKLKKYKDKEITVHAAHHKHGFDAGIDREEENKARLDQAKKAADIVDSPWIIVHPGTKVSDESEERMIDFMKDNWDDRIVFENVISYVEKREEHHLFSLPQEMERLLEIFDTGMVLDFDHAIATANGLGKDPDKIIEQFFELNPTCYHASGLDKDANIDEHRHFFGTENDYEYLSEISEERYLTLETPGEDMHDRELQKKDLEIVKEKYRE